MEPLLATCICLSATYCVISPTPLGAARALVLTLGGVAGFSFLRGNWALGLTMTLWAVAVGMAAFLSIAVSPPAPTDPPSPRRNEWMGGAIALGAFFLFLRSTLLALRHPPTPGPVSWNDWLPLGVALLGVTILGWFQGRKYG